MLPPAIDYARNGFPLVPRIVQAIVAVQALFRSEWHTSAEVWLPGSRVPHPGELFRAPATAATYERLLTEAKGENRKARIDAAIDLWYRGFVARQIDDFYRNAQVRDCTGERNGGLLRYDDMANWHASYDEPVTTQYGRYTLAKCGVWSQGPVFLQQIGMLRHQDIAGLQADGPEFVHRVAEAAKLAFADRLAWYGDPAHVDVPLAALIGDGYARERAALIGARASDQLRPGSPGGRMPRLPDLSAGARALARADTRFGVGEPTFAPLPAAQEWASRELFVGDTCHIDVIDRHGNMVAATPSGGWLSSSPAVPGLGFAVSTRLQMSWLDEGLPGTVAPGKRPCTTLSPGLALRDGEPYMAFGTPGGDQQDQWTVAFFLRHAVLGMNLQEAIDAPSWHIDHFPGSFWPRNVTLNRLTAESRFSEATLQALRAAGHEVKVGPPWSEGRISVCTRESAGGALLLRAAANPRGMQSYAVGR